MFGLFKKSNKNEEDAGQDTQAKSSSCVSETLEIDLNCQVISEAREKKINDSFAVLSRLRERVSGYYMKDGDSSYVVVTDWQKNEQGKCSGWIDVATDYDNVNVELDISLDVEEDYTADGKTTLDCGFRVEFWIDVDGDDEDSNSIYKGKSLEISEDGLTPKAAELIIKNASLS